MNGDTPIPWRCGAYFSTGRDALCALLADICARPAADCVLPVPRRLWLPGYYCPDVVGTLLPLALAVPLELRTYPAPPPGLPDLARIPLAPGDLLLLVNLFGLHGASTTPRLPPGVVLIEDHTHDPLSRWARTSTADWCFASLRKTLPLPDGGVVWSPGGRALPRPPVLTLQRRLASLEMLAAMTLRSAQPSGATAAPETIRELELKAEARLQSGAVSGMPPWTREMLEDLPLAQLRVRRLAAHHRLCAALDATAGRAAGAEPPRPAMAPGVRLLRPAAAVGAAGGCGPGTAPGHEHGPVHAREGRISGPTASCPYAAVLWFAQPAARERARRLLENTGVETLVLWPLEGHVLPGVRSAEELAFSARVLAVLRLEDRPAQRGPGEATRLAALLRDAEAAGVAETR